MSYNQSAPPPSPFFVFICFRNSEQTLGQTQVTCKLRKAPERTLKIYEDHVEVIFNS